MRLQATRFWHLVCMLVSGNLSYYNCSKILRHFSHLPILGARIIELKRSDSGGDVPNWEFQVVAAVTIHKSMCYACDVAPLKASESVQQSQKRLIVSTSFYDKLLCVWNYDPEADIEKS